MLLLQLPPRRSIERRQPASQPASQPCVPVRRTQSSASLALSAMFRSLCVYVSVSVFFEEKKKKMQKKKKEEKESVRERGGCIDFQARRIQGDG